MMKRYVAIAACGLSLLAGQVFARSAVRVINNSQTWTVTYDGNKEVLPGGSDWFFIGEKDRDSTTLLAGSHTITLRDIHQACDWTFWVPVAWTIQVSDRDAKDPLATGSDGQYCASLSGDWFDYNTHSEIVFEDTGEGILTWESHAVDSTM